MNNKKEYALYIHIPFCARKCNYCDFTSHAGIDHLIPEYLEALKKELTFYAENLKEPRLKTVFFGGGTPSLLDPNDIRSIMDHIKSGFKFGSNAEISLEANPGTLNFLNLVKLNKIGINRLSLGAQSFDDDHLKVLGRIHSSDNIKYTFWAARHAGFDNINLDLMFALPHQSVEDWEKTLKEALSLRPDHISTYNLTIEEGTPLHKDKKRLALPSNEEEFEMFDLSIKMLADKDFKHYEISNFAKPGKECRNNLVYWDNEEYIGAGAGATSYMDGRRYSNAKDIDSYIANWRDENAGINLIESHKSFKRNSSEEISDAMFLGLRKLEGVDPRELLSKYDIDPFDLYKKELNELSDKGLIEMNDSRIKLSKKGLFLANEVFERFV